MESGHSEKRIGKYAIYRTLGRGGTCKVKLGRDTSTGEYVAVKIMSEDLDAEDLQLVLNEVEAIRSVEHPNVIKIVECGEDDYVKPSGATRVNYIIVQHAAGGELFDFISDTGRFPEPLARYYFRQFMEGLSNVHNRGLAHRDLKPENILLDGNFDLKIADFGFAAPMQGKNGDGYLRTRLGTKNHMAPEIHLRKPYKGDLVDLFAAAIILFTMVSQHPPFNTAQPSDPYYKCIGGGKYDTFWNAHTRNKEGGGSFYSDDYKSMVTQMMALDPAKRLTMDEVMSHPWYTNPTVPSRQQVRAEFYQRQKILQENLEAERAAKEAARNRATQRMFPARSGGSETIPQAELGEPKKQLMPYEKAFQQGTQFKTTCHPDLVENALLSYLEEQGITTKVDQNKYKIKFDQSIPVEGKGKPNEISVRITILQDMENQGEYCVEFTKMKGATFPFTQIYNDIKERALDFANEKAASTIPEEATD